MKGLGDNATAAMLRAAADKLSALVRSKLYVGGDAGGFWACEQPDGRLVQVRHVIDFISIGASVRRPPCQLIHALTVPTFTLTWPTLMRLCIRLCLIHLLPCFAAPMPTPAHSR